MDKFPEELTKLIDCMDVTLKSSIGIRDAFVEMAIKYRDMELGNSPEQVKGKLRRTMFCYLTMIRSFVEKIQKVIGMELVNELYASMCEEFDVHDIEDKIKESLLERDRK